MHENAGSHVLLHHPQVSDAAMFATFLCMNERSGSHCVAGDIIAGGRRWRRRRRSVAMMTEAYADEQTDSGTEERPKDGVEDRPATYSGRQHSS